MTRTYFHDWFLDDETKVTVEYSLSPYDPGVSSGPAELCYPPEGGEVEIIKAWLYPNGKDIALTEEQEMSLIDEILRLPADAYDDGGYDDWYAERDL